MLSKKGDHLGSCRHAGIILRIIGVLGWEFENIPGIANRIMSDTS